MMKYPASAIFHDW